MPAYLQAPPWRRESKADLDTAAAYVVALGMTTKTATTITWAICVAIAFVLGLAIGALIG